MVKKKADAAPGKGADLKIVPKDGEKAENPKAVAGDNQLTEDQRAALFFNHLKKYEESLAAKKKADADFRNVTKMIKAEGTELKDIKTALTLQTEEGEKTIKSEIEDQIRVAKWLGYSVGYQIDLFPDRRPSGEKAFDDGKVAGLAGLAMKPPFDPGPLHDRFVAGWRAGQDALVAKLAPKAPEQQPKPPAAPAAAPEAKAPAPPKPSMAGGLEDQPQDKK